MRRTHDLDSTDFKILALLEQDGRRPQSEIGRLVGLSAATVAERIGRLRDIGVIRGFTVQLDAARLGCPVAAIVEFQPRSSLDSSGIAAVVANPAVRACYRVTGGSLLVLIVKVPSTEELRSTLGEFLKYGETKTSVIMHTDFEDRPFLQDRLPKTAAEDLR